MSRVFSKVSPKLWRSRRFCSLPSDDAKLAFLYLLTSEHQNIAGCYRLLDGYATADLGWPLNRYQQARKQLVEAGMIKFDAEENEVMIDGWFDHNPPMNDSHYIGIERQLERIDSDAIREDAEEALSEVWDAIHERRHATSQKKQSTANASLNGSERHITGRLDRTDYMKGIRR